MLSYTRSLSVAVLLTAFSGTLMAQTPPACAECQTSLPASATAAYRTNTLPSSQGYIRITLSNVAPGYGIANGVYQGWCGDDANAPVSSASEPVTPYSTMGTLPAGSQDPDWPKVNWILNNKQGTYREIQQAIWIVLRGAGAFPITPAVTSMVNGANANPAFVPGPGQIQGILLYMDGFGNKQETVIEVVVPECGVIGDFVWHDTNRDGLQNELGTGIQGVTVRLRNSSNVEISNMQTGPNGEYLFKGLCSGTYSVVVDNPSGMTQTYAAGGADPTADSNPQPAVTTLNVSNEATRKDLTLDFGFATQCESTIGDLVWLDTNQNGLQDIGEPGIQGVELTLTGPGGPRVTTTNATGNYMFGGLCAGTYTVTVNAATVPPTYTPTTPNAGDDRGADSNGSPTTVIVNSNTIDNTLDFGYKPPCTGTIGNFIWMDTNQNGLQDVGEPGINGLVVQLRRNNVTLQTTTTAGNGGYLFQGVCAGNYDVVVDETNLPPGVTRTESPGGANPALDSNPHPAPVSLPTNMSSDLTIDFGYRPPPCTASMGDFVWFDTNGNGIQDSGEPGIPNVTLELRDAMGALVGAPTTTDANGKYSFSGLCAGTYKIRVYTPSTSFQPSPTNVGGPATDSNPNNDTVVLGYNTVDRTYDFGFKSAGLCTFTQGYWKNHEEVWPVSSLMIGDQLYQKSELLAIFRTPVRGDSSLNLAHQLIAAKLNFYRGAAVPSQLPGWMTSADALLSGFGRKLPYDVKSDAMVSLSGNLDKYNNGQIAGASHCDDSGGTGGGGSNGGGGNGGGGGGNGGGGGTTPPPSNVNCHFTQGYWKNHEEVWPATSLTLGSQTYTKAQLLTIFGLSVSGDASINLAHQLIAAKLNVINGGATTIVSKIAEADALLATYSGKLPYNVASSSTKGAQMVSIAGALDTYNNIKTACSSSAGSSDRGTGNGNDKDKNK